MERWKWFDQRFEGHGTEKDEFQSDVDQDECQCQV